MELSGRGWGRPQEITLHLIVRAFCCWSSLDKIPMLILSNYFTMIADLFFKLIEPRNFLLKGKHVRGMLGWHLSSKNFCLGCVVPMCNDLGRVKYSLGMGVGSKRRPLVSESAETETTSARASVCFPPLLNSFIFLISCLWMLLHISLYLWLQRIEPYDFPLNEDTWRITE